MHKFNTALVAKGLTAYAIERQHGWERRLVEGMDPLLLGERALEPEDLAVFELYATEGSQITFCLDVLAQGPSEPAPSQTGPAM